MEVAAAQTGPISMAAQPDAVRLVKVIYAVILSTTEGAGASDHFLSMGKLRTIPLFLFKNSLRIQARLCLTTRDQWSWKMA